MIYAKNTRAIIIPCVEACVRYCHKSVGLLNLTLVMTGYKFCGKKNVCLIFHTLPHTLTRKSDFRLIKNFSSKNTRGHAPK